MDKVINVFTPVSIILFAVVLRLLPHPPNFAPIAAMALFGGAYLNKRYALIVPLLAMVISDMFLGFHSGIPVVYACFLITGLIGMWIKKRKTFKTIITASFGSSILFFLITNFNYWYVDAWYPKTLAGLRDSYISALPFFRNTVLGDLLFTGLFFGSYELIKKFLWQKKYTQN